MNLREINELIFILKDEISKGIDVDFNKRWLQAIQNSITSSVKTKSETHR